MLYNKLLFILVTVLVAYYSIHPAQGVGCSNCPPGNQCCNDLNNNQGLPTCYNPSTHQCNNGTRLCPLNQLSCGKACYSPSAYQCNAGDRLCPKEFESCGSSCYSPWYHACVNGQLVNNCVPGACGFAACCPVNGACFNPIHAVCTNQGVFVRCGGLPSFDPAVCSGHGTCSAYNTCTCRPGWSGYLCETPSS